MKETKYEVREGYNYIVVIGPGDTINTPTADFMTAEVAEQFVLARNSHNEMVRALQAARNYIETYGVTDQDSETLTPQAQSAMSIIRAALAKATEAA